MNFDIIFAGTGNRLDSFDEGVEFGFRNLNSGRGWIPLVFYSFYDIAQRNVQIKIGPMLTVVIRGYNVPIYVVGTHRAELKLCGSEIIQSNASLSFRWLQTALTKITTNIDTAYLDNVAISINFPEGYNIMTLLEDDFNSEVVIK